MVLIVVVMVGLLGAGFVNLTSSMASRQAGAVDNLKAFYLAEAGLAEAFHAVRMGRSGQIGTEAVPARFGQGLLWVDAFDTAEGDIRLESTAFAGLARTTLGLTVTPLGIELGFFSDQDLLIDSVLLTDGFDSSEGTYGEHLPGGGTVEIDPTHGSFYDDPALGVLYQLGTFYRYQARYGSTVHYDHAATRRELYDAGYGPGGPYEAWLDDWGELNKVESATAQAAAYFDTLGDTPTPTPVVSALGATTGNGALLGSNGDVRFSVPSGEAVEVWGDVTPGPAGSVTGLAGVAVSGSTGPRSLAVELPVVEVPDVSLAPPVRHEDLVPMLVPAGTSGHAQIVVAADAELVLRGPATVVIGELVLEPGALLTLDTRLGDVALYITAEMDLQEGSLVANTGEAPDETTVQVGAVPEDPLNPAVKLDATAQFHGTIYAPDADVRIGSEFEVYGGVVARRLEIAAGARLHYDSTGFDGAPIPEIVGWRIVEMPAAAPGATGDPYRRLGLTPAQLDGLHDCHDLGSVWMTLTYVDQVGAERAYEGSEDLFDWGQVAAVVEVEREATRKADPDGEATAGSAEPRPEVEDALDTLSGAALMDYLVANSPLAESELLDFVVEDSMNSALQLDVLMANTPLPESVLTTLVGRPDGEFDAATGEWSNPDGVDQALLMDVLVANSPLPASTLDAMEAAPTTVLRDALKDEVRAAQ